MSNNIKSSLGIEDIKIHLMHRVGDIRDKKSDPNNNR